MTIRVSMMNVQKRIMQKALKKNKYRNKPQVVDGIKFRSTLEATYYGMLKLLKQQGVITAFQCQHKIKIIIGTTYITTYVADFRIEYPDGRVEIVDCKSKATRTHSYLIKRNLLRALYNVEIKEIFKK